MSVKGISGTSIAMIGIGSMLAYSGVKGKHFSDVARKALSGESPAEAESKTAIDSAVTADASLASEQSATQASAITGGNQASNQAIGKLLAAPYGWATGTEWTALVNLWNKESSWNNLAENPSSGAYGIPQALPPDKLPTKGQKPYSDAATQIQWGLSYIKSRYGSPSAAWAHETQVNWY